MDINQLTAQKIRKIRMDLGFTSDFVAQELGISKSSYSKLENGHTELSINKVDSLSKIFNLPLVAILPVTQSSTINITNGDNSISGTQINHNNDPQLIQTIQTTIELLQKTMDGFRK